jgi:hypothetical protein
MTAEINPTRDGAVPDGYIDDGLFGEYRSVYIRSSTAPSSGYAQETAKSRPLFGEQHAGGGE